MGDLDEMSRLIGELQGTVTALQLSHTSVNRAVFKKLDTLQIEQTKQKVNAAVVTVKMSMVTAVIVLGLVEGIKYTFKTYGGH